LTWNRSSAGRQADTGGRAAEALVAAFLESGGWTMLGARVRTKAGEIDLVATKDGLLLLGEVKSNFSHEKAGFALGARQRRRLIEAAVWLLAEHPEWGNAGVRFDVFLVDRAGAIDWIEDAIREDEG